MHWRRNILRAGGRELAPLSLKPDKGHTDPRSSLPEVARKNDRGKSKKRTPKPRILRAGIKF